MPYNSGIFSLSYSLYSPALLLSSYSFSMSSGSKSLSLEKRLRIEIDGVICGSVDSSSSTSCSFLADYSYSLIFRSSLISSTKILGIFFNPYAR
jgi:hypothetical protein